MAEMTCEVGTVWNKHICCSKPGLGCDFYLLLPEDECEAKCHERETACSRDNSTCLEITAGMIGTGADIHVEGLLSWPPLLRRQK